MMTDFDTFQLSEYRNMLGAEALRRLWKDFAAETEMFLAKASELKQNELRIKFHNLRAGALVFGLQKFSASCAALEEAVLKGISAEELAAEIVTAHKTFEKQSAKVDAFLEL